MRPPPRKLPLWIPAVVAAAWCAGTAYAFWSLELEDRRPLDPATVKAYFDVSRAAPRAEAWFRANALPADGTAAAPVTVVHVSRPGCACDRSAERHLAEIRARYAATPIAFRQARVDWVAATPAALVFDAGGRLVYFGPYSDDADCGRRRGFVEEVLDALGSGRRDVAPNVLGVGCYCVTREPTRT